MPEGIEARGRSGSAATGAGAALGTGFAAALPGPGGGADFGPAIEIAGAGVGWACDWSIERGLPWARRISGEVPVDFGKAEFEGIFSGTGWAAV